MDVRITIVGPGDEHLFGSVAEDVFDHPVTAPHLTCYLEQPNHVMCVAIAGGQVRAVILTQPDRPPELYFDNAGVAPAFQRRGIATRMFEEIMRVGRERGCHEVWVGTEPDNEPAKALYRSLGLPMQPMVFFEGKL